MNHPWSTIGAILLAFTGLFLMFIILLQRGRGGGLAGAFGAMGGQSAFGTKAGDVFTKITIGVAIVWVALAAATGYAMRTETSFKFRSEAKEDVLAPGNPQNPAQNQPVTPQKEATPSKGAAANAADQTKASTGTQSRGPALPNPSGKGSAKEKPAAGKPAPDNKRAQ
jgi:preprotein translocase subunit SecG